MSTRREARTSVLPEGQNLGAGGIQFRRAMKKRVPGNGRVHFRATPEDYFATAIWESEGLGDLTGREADQ